MFSLKSPKYITWARCVINRNNSWWQQQFFESNISCCWLYNESWHFTVFDSSSKKASIILCFGWYFRTEFVIAHTAHRFPLISSFKKRENQQPLCLVCATISYVIHTCINTISPTSVQHLYITHKHIKRNHSKLSTSSDIDLIHLSFTFFVVRVTSFDSIQFVRMTNDDSR